MLGHYEMGERLGYAGRRQLCPLEKCHDFFQIGLAGVAKLQTVTVPGLSCHAHLPLL
jgi:hypothetical protein